MRLSWVLIVAVPLVAAAQAPRAQGPLRLSLKRAVELAVAPEGSARIQVAGETVKQAQSRSAQARGALLPDLSSSFSYANQTRNLAAMGIKFTVPGFQFPSLAGPFNTMDARVSGTQTILDISALRRFQASKAGVAAAKSDFNAATEQVAANVARAYVGAVRADADVETAEANLKLAGAVLQQAENQKQAGTGTGIDVTRSRVQMANTRQRLLVAQNARRAGRLQLLRAMGLRLDTELELTDRLQYVPVDAVTLEQARTAAMKARPDYQSQQERESNARLAASATKLERLPSIAAVADYGSSGTGLGNALPTRTYGISLRLPIFDGGRRDARRAESESVYRAEKVRTGDMKDQIELDVRLALDRLHSAEEQVQVAREGLDLAASELAQAQRRYEAGVANSLEVTDAQTRLERARDNQTDALCNHSLARVDLAQSLGRARDIAQ